MKELDREHHIYMLEPGATPAITIDSGEELMVETWDAFEGVSDPGVIGERYLKGPASGPIYVNGAEPGDALKIDFISITPKDGAAHMVMPGRGFLDEEFTEGFPTVISFEDGYALLPNGIRLPLNPSMGLVATTPTYSQITASDSGPYGGDIDMKELVAGSSLYLTVFVPGGLLVLGDCHALVGDGAVAGTGAECSADTHLRVTVEKGDEHPGAPSADPGPLCSPVPWRRPGPGHETGRTRRGGLPGDGERDGPLRSVYPVQLGRRCPCSPHLPPHQPGQNDAVPPGPGATLEPKPGSSNT